MSIDSLKDFSFADNPEQRCPCVLLLDNSGSMSGASIQALNAGLAAFKAETAADHLASKRIEVAIVTFGGSVQIAQDFVTLDEFVPPTLQASGQTPMASGVERALDMVEGRKAVYKANGVAYYRPWIFMITDGAPTDPEHLVQTSAERLVREQIANKVVFFAVGTEGADFPRLAQFTIPERPPVKLNGLQFVELFVWLSRSQQAVAQSRIGEQVPLPPAGWQAV